MDVEPAVTAAPVAGFRSTAPVSETEETDSPKESLTPLEGISQAFTFYVLRGKTKVQAAAP